MERAGGIEHSISWLETKHSSIELHPRNATHTRVTNPQWLNFDVAENCNTGFGHATLN